MAAFSLLRFFWLRKRNEGQKKTKCREVNFFKNKKLAQRDSSHNIIEHIKLNLFQLLIKIEVQTLLDPETSSG